MLTFKFLPFTLQKTATAVGISLTMAVVAAPRAWAETVVDRVARTGVLRAGTNRTARPFAYMDDRGQAYGYSVDMLHRIREQLAADLGREVKLELTSLASDQRIPAILQGAVDIICDASSFTWERDRQIDFSISYGVTGTRLLLRKDSNLSGEPESLAGKRVAALPQTTNAAAIRRVQPDAELVLFNRRADTYLALQRGDVDALAADGVFLEAWLDKNVFADQFEIADYAYSREGVACMVPQDNSSLLNSVNYSLASFMQGVVEGKAADVQIFDRWFGDDSVVPLSQDLRELALENMRLVLDFHEAIPAKPSRPASPSWPSLLRKSRLPSRSLPTGTGGSSGGR